MIFSSGFILFIVGMFLREIMITKGVFTYSQRRATDWLVIGPFAVGIILMLLSLVMLMRTYLP